MSERKTSEIKFRVAPSEKARWQAEAERKQLGLSELIRERMNEERTQPRSVLLADDGDLETRGIPADEVFPAGKPNPFAPNEELPVAPCGGACGDCSCPKEGSGLREFISTNITEVGPPLSKELLLEQWERVAAPQTDVQEPQSGDVPVGTSGEVGAVEEKPQYPWMFRG